VAIVVAGMLLVLEAASFRPLHPYRGNLGAEPYQAVIDAATRAGGLVFWSFPEARDLEREPVGAWSSVTLRTDPHPEMLLRTGGYTGFGGVYPDTVTFTEPGREWDRALAEYAEGRRTRPPWSIGEVGYHGPPKPLDEAITVCWLPERSRRALLTALAEGRCYGTRPLDGYHLLLDDFAVAQEPEGPGAGMGAELVTAGPRPLRLRLSLSASDGRTAPVSVRVIKSGRVVAELTGRTPFQGTWTDDPPGRGRREVYRLQVVRPHVLLSNPVFVRGPA